MVPDWQTTEHASRVRETIFEQARQVCMAYRMDASSELSCDELQGFRDMFLSAFEPGAPELLSTPSPPANAAEVTLVAAPVHAIAEMLSLEWEGASKAEILAWMKLLNEEAFAAEMTLRRN